MSEVPDTAPTSFVIVELATRPRQAFRFAEQADALRLAERLRRADPDAAVRTQTPEEARAVLLDLAFVPEDAIGPLIIMESRHLDRETVEGGIIAYMRDFLAQWSDYRVEAQEFIEAGDSIVVTERQYATGEWRAIETVKSFYAVWTFRDGLVAHVRWDDDRDTALAAAGLAE